MILLRFACVGMAFVVGSGVAHAQPTRPQPPPSNSPDAPAPEVQRLAALAGEWDLHLTQFRPAKGVYEPVPTGPCRVDVLLEGRFVRMTIELRTGPRPIRNDFFWSFDQFQHTYRLAVLDDYFGLLDSHEGAGDGTSITVNNLKAHTVFPTPRGDLLAEFQLRITGPDGFSLAQRATADEGKTWAPVYRATATRVRR